MIVVSQMRNLRVDVNRISRKRESALSSAEKMMFVSTMMGGSSAATPLLLHHRAKPLPRGALCFPRQSSDLLLGEPELTAALFQDQVVQELRDPVTTEQGRGNPDDEVVFLVIEAICG
jgi:hypothetical protein